ncbi:MAG TPA: hypothetical protein VME66_15480 [Candidatus Acidoferrales bacterium]|nr:hypothetical protein [Candidatus Acidoferrales bacterium]
MATPAPKAPSGSTAPAQHHTDASVTVRTDAAAVRFLQQNQAVAATLDAGAIAVTPQALDSRSVMAHEYAHIAQLRSGVTASRADAERRADDVAAGRSIQPGGAAAPPLFQAAPLSTQTPFVPGPERFGAEQRDLGELGAGAPEHATITGSTTMESNDLSFHVDVNGGGANGSIASSSDITVHVDPSQQYGSVVVGPGVGPSTGIGIDPEGIPAPVAPAPTKSVELYPVHILYTRSIVLTDTDGRKVEVHVESHVYCDYNTWFSQIRGRPATFETLLAIEGDLAFGGFELVGDGPVQAYRADHVNRGRSLGVQSMLAESAFASGAGLFGLQSDMPAAFVRPELTAGAQFASLEAFLKSADALELARRAELEKQRREDLGWFGRLMEDTGLQQELDDALNAIGSFFSGIGSAISDFWSSLPAPVRGVLEALGKAVVAIGAVIGLAAVVVALAPEELAIGTVALVIGACMLAFSFGYSLVTRAKEAIDAGVYDPAVVIFVALMDAIGLSSVIEAFTNRSIISGKDLGRSEEERYESGTSGLIQMIMLALGVREFGKGTADPTSGGRETLLDPGRDPLFEGGISDSDLNEDNFRTEDVTGSRGKKRIGGKKVPERPFDEPTRRRLDRDVIRRRPGESVEDALDRTFNVIGKKISDTPLRADWDLAKQEVIGTRPESSFSDEEMLENYEKIRDKFWDRVRADPSAVQFLRDANIEFEQGSRAPMIQVNDPNVPWFERKINLDHIQEKALNPRRATDPTNLEFQSQGGNVNRENIQQRHPELR